MGRARCIQPSLRMCVCDGRTDEINLPASPARPRCVRRGLQAKPVRRHQRCNGAPRLNGRRPEGECPSRDRAIQSSFLYPCSALLVARSGFGRGPKTGFAGPPEQNKCVRACARACACSLIRVAHGLIVHLGVCFATALLHAGAFASAAASLMRSELRARRYRFTQLWRRCARWFCAVACRASRVAPCRGASFREVRGVPGRELGMRWRADRGRERICHDCAGRTASETSKATKRTT